MATITWLGGHSGHWSKAADWSGGVVPAAGDDVVIGTADTVFIDTAAAATDISLGTGSVLDVTASLALSGTLTGGTVDLVGGSVALGTNAALDGVKWIGGPLVVADGDTVTVSGGLTVRGAHNTDGTIELQAEFQATSLVVADSETWNNETITGSAEIDVYGTSNADKLTLGGGETVISPLGDGLDFASYNPATGTHSTVVNKGLVVADGLVGMAFGTFDNVGMIEIGPGGIVNPFEELFSNTGTIAATGGGTGTFTTYYPPLQSNGQPDGSPITNYDNATGRLAGGTWEAAAGSTLDLQLESPGSMDAPIIILDATTVLTGPEAAIQTWNAGTSTWESIASTVTSQGGSLQLLDGADWETSNKLAVHGNVTLDGGTLSATGGLDVASMALVIGFGTILSGAKPLFLAGNIAAHDGLLDIGGGIAGSGGLGINGGATLELGGSAAQTVTFDGLATLVLDDPRHFTGSLADVVAGDTLMLGPATNATGAMLSGGTLTIDNASGPADHIAVSGSTTGVTFVHAGIHTIIGFT